MIYHMAASKIYDKEELVETFTEFTEYEKDVLVRKLLSGKRICKQETIDGYITHFVPDVVTVTESK